MPDQFVTLESYDNPLAANLAKNRLQEAGIRAFLAGEQLVGMNWMASNAVGGIRLQVAEADLLEAETILKPPIRAEGDARFEEAFDGDSVAADAIQKYEPTEADFAEADVEEPEANSREQAADRAFRVAIFGVLLLPLQLYASWLLFRVYLSSEELRPNYRRRAWLAAVINVPIMLGFGFVCARFGKV